MWVYVSIVGFEGEVMSIAEWWGFRLWPLGESRARNERSIGRRWVQMRRREAWDHFAARQITLAECGPVIPETATNPSWGGCFSIHICIYRKAAFFNKACVKMWSRLLWTLVLESMKMNETEQCFGVHTTYGHAIGQQPVSTFHVALNLILRFEAPFMASWTILGVCGGHCLNLGRELVVLVDSLDTPRMRQVSQKDWRFGHYEHPSMLLAFQRSLKVLWTVVGDLIHLPSHLLGDGNREKNAILEESHAKKSELWRNNRYDVSGVWVGERSQTIVLIFFKVKSWVSFFVGISDALAKLFVQYCNIVFLLLHNIVTLWCQPFEAVVARRRRTES